jgi:hypothetical protein
MLNLIYIENEKDGQKLTLMWFLKMYRLPGLFLKIMVE